MAKDRSPNYPAYDLGTAVEYAQRVYKAVGKSGAAPHVMAVALGYGGLSGSARQKIAAMRQYGLLEDAPKKELRLSQRAIDLINLRPTDAEYAKVVREAMLAPALFREFQDKSPDASDRILEVQLTTGGRGFSPEGARRLIKSYRDSMAFANAGAQGYNGAGGGANGEDDPPAGETPGGPKPGNGAPHDPVPKPPRPPEANTVTYSWPLDDADRVEVTFVGNPGTKPTRRDLEALIEMLEARRKRTPAASEEPQGAE